MAGLPLTETAVPAPHTGQFVDGESALSVWNPPEEAPGQSIYYLAKWFDFKGGTYRIKAVCDDAAVWSVSQTQNNARTILSHTLDDGAIQATVYIPRGRQRLDIILSNTTVGTSPCRIAFSIWQDDKLVYASAAAGWLWLNIPLTDSDVPALPDRRLSLPLLAVLPNWVGGVTERLEWLTEVLPSEMAIEQRRSLRRYPRRSFEASFSRHDLIRARLASFFTGVGRHEALIPVWHEQYRLTETLGITVTFPDETLLMREYRAGDLVMVNDKNPSDYEVLTIASHDLVADTITFTVPPVGTWLAGSRITPLRVARAMEGPTLSNATDRVGTVQARFTLSGPDKYVEPSWGYCSQLFAFKTNWQTSVDVTFGRTDFLIDNEIGVTDLTDPGGQASLGIKLGLTLFGRKEVYEFRQFIHAARGRAIRFWLPSQTADLIPDGDFDGTYIDLLPGGHVEYVERTQASRKVIAITFKTDRPVIYCNVTGGELTVSGERIYVETPLPLIPLSEINRIMFVMPVRFDQDAFELQHPVDDSAAVRVTLVMRTVALDDMPSLECAITSQPYPVVMNDAIDSSAVLTGATLRPFGYPPEAIDVGTDLTAATLRDVLLQAEFGPEGIDASTNITGATLRDAIKQVESLPEGIDASVTITGGFVDGKLLTYQNYAPEGIDSGVTLTGGTLT